MPRLQTLEKDVASVSKSLQVPFSTASARVPFSCNVERSARSLALLPERAQTRRGCNRQPYASRDRATGTLLKSHQLGTPSPSRAHDPARHARAGCRNRAAGSPRRLRVTAGDVAPARRPLREGAQTMQAGAVETQKNVKAAKHYLSDIAQARRGKRRGGVGE